jgi:N-acyl-D-aspartate/D-glutamate deacylase
MGLFDRGAIREGLWADLTIFDYDRIRDRATYAQPSAPPEGIDYVLVNGEVVVERGRHTGARPGRVLRGPGALAARSVTPSHPSPQTPCCKSGRLIYD